MPIKLNGATNGSVELDVPAAVGSDLQITLPATAGTAIVKAADGSVDLGSVDIDSSGRLLVGTSSQIGSSSAGNAFLQIKGRSGGAVGRLTLATTNSNPGANSTIGSIYFTETSGGNYGLINCVSDGTSGTNDYPGRLTFSTTADGASSPTERLRIDSSGNVLFGSDQSTTPWNRSSGSSTLSWLEDKGNAGGSLALANSADNGFAGIYINKFDYNPGDDNRFIDFRINGGSSIGTITYNGTGTSYNTSSDYRLKENVVALTNGIDRLKQLNVNRFNFIGNTVVVDGFIAHLDCHVNVFQ